MRRGAGAGRLAGIRGAPASLSVRAHRPGRVSRRGAYRREGPPRAFDENEAVAAPSHLPVIRSRTRFFRPAQSTRVRRRTQETAGRVARPSGGGRSGVGEPNRKSMSRFLRTAVFMLLAHCHCAGGIRDSQNGACLYERDAVMLLHLPRLPYSPLFCLGLRVVETRQNRRGTATPWGGCPRLLSSFSDFQSFLLGTSCLLDGIHDAERGY